MATLGRYPCKPDSVLNAKRRAGTICTRPVSALVISGNARWEFLQENSPIVFSFAFGQAAESPLSYPHRIPLYMECGVETTLESQESTLLHESLIVSDGSGTRSYRQTSIGSWCTCLNC